MCQYAGFVLQVMSNSFSFDVFLSHSSKDKAVVRSIAERLRSDGLRVWFDDWELHPGDSIPAKIEEGLEQSRVLVLCMSTNAFGSDWAHLEAGTFRFRDPLNKERRFIPLRLDLAQIRGSLAQFVYISWLPQDREQEYRKLLEACGLRTEQKSTEMGAARVPNTGATIKLYSTGQIFAYAFSPDGKRALTGGSDKTARLWDLQTGACLSKFEGHSEGVGSVAWSTDQRLALSGSDDYTARLWDIESGRCLRVFEEHKGQVKSVAWETDQRRFLTGSSNRIILVWDVGSGYCIGTLEGHRAPVWSVAFSADGRRALSGADDNTIRLWDVENGKCIRVFSGHTGYIWKAVWSADESQILSGSTDGTVRLWDVRTGRCVRVLEGHTDEVKTVACCSDRRYALSGSNDGTVRLWNLDTGQCPRVLERTTPRDERSRGLIPWVVSVAWVTDRPIALSGDNIGGVWAWDLSEFVEGAEPPRHVVVPKRPSPDQVQYTNAKVLLVGESGAGKTGLSKVLAGEGWRPTDSTVGTWATQWKLPVSSDDGIEREIWLWDFGGQADQRLIHQLYMEDTALAVLVFDGQKEDLFETLGQWDRDLTRASRKPFTKLLAAGRVDAGGLRYSRSQVDKFKEERGFSCYLETSAKANIGCTELKQAIVDGIHWEDIPWRSSPLLFKRLKDEIIRLKDEGRVLMRFNELRDALRLRLAGENEPFRDEELKAVVGLLAGPGVVWELAFGSWVLLQPERINAYAQAVIQTMRADEHERGCLPEERVLKGDLMYQSSITRLGRDDERFVLLAMHQTLVERGLCLREHTDKGPLLIFPSYYRRERPELVGHPAVLVSYRFSGFLDDIYATLVVRLHHTKPFQQDQLWRYAADFKTLTGKQLGVKLTRRAEGAGELAVYFDPTISVEEKIIFSRYVHEHLLQKGQELVRLRHYVCPHCGTPVGNREVATRRLEVWLEKKATEQAQGGGRIKSWVGKADMPTIICSECEERVPLWDDLEQSFASDEIQQRVRELQEQSNIVLDNESKERALVGEVISTVALAGQICREFNVSDHGIDMEIEFKDDASEATGKKLYLQLKSGDSYLRERRRDNAEVFTIKDERHTRYWMGQAFPVLLVIRTSGGEVRWMEVGNWLKCTSDKGRKPVKRIVFEGERFDVMSVRRWREKVLGRL